LLTLVQRNIPFAFTLNGLYDHPRNNRTYWKDIFLGEFDSRQTQTCFVHYNDFKTSPGFHVDDTVWQSTFAGQCLEIIQA